MANHNDVYVKWENVRACIGDDELLLHIVNYFSSDQLDAMLDDAIDQHDLRYFHPETFGSLYGDDEDE